MTLIKPKPCPFCGSTPILNSQYHCVECSNGSCAVLPSTWMCDTDEEAVELWNNRMDCDEYRDTCHEVCRVFVCPDCPNWNDEFCDCEMDEPYCIDRIDEFFKTHELYAERGKYCKIWKSREKVANDRDR